MLCHLVMKVNEPALVAAAASVIAVFDLFPRHSLQLHHSDPEDPSIKKISGFYQIWIILYCAICINNKFTVGLDSKDLRLPTFPTDGAATLLLSSFLLPTDLMSSAASLSWERRLFTLMLFRGLASDGEKKGPATAARGCGCIHTLIAIFNYYKSSEKLLIV